MMRYEIRTDASLGRILWLTDGRTEIGVALDFGIRVIHLSCAGMENLFYRQPEDLSDGFVTDAGWRLYGGHRFCLAPEGEQTYAPDNAPVDYRLLDSGVTLIQNPDRLLGVVKSLTISFLPEGIVRLLHEVRNQSDEPISAALWGINTLAPGGTAVVDFAADAPGTTAPGRVVALWGQTSLADARVRFEKDRFVARQLPVDDYFKIGLFSKGGKAVFENLSQRLVLEYEALQPERYADLGCNFEVYLGRHFMELETLGIRRIIGPGESATHVEQWRLEAR